MDMGPRKKVSVGSFLMGDTFIRNRIVEKQRLLLPAIKLILGISTFACSISERCSIRSRQRSARVFLAVTSRGIVGITQRLRQSLVEAPMFADSRC